MKKIKTQILTYFALTIVIAVLVINSTIFSFVYKAIESNAKDKLVYLTNQKATEYEKTFLTTESNVDTLAKIISESFDYNQFKTIEKQTQNYDKDHIPYISYYVKNTLNPLTYELVKKTPSVMGGYFCFFPDFLKNRFLIGPWVSKISSDDNFDYIFNGYSADIYPLQKHSSEWFYEPMIKKRATWSDVYKDEDLKIDMLSHSQPVYVKNKFIGVAGMDISLDQIEHSIEALKIYKTGHATLIDRDYKVIFSPLLKAGSSLKDLEKTEFKKLEKTIQNKTDEIISVKRNNIDYYISCKNITNDFILIIAVPKSEVYAELNKFKALWSFLILMFLGFSTYIAHKISKNIATPIEKLTHASEMVSFGGLNATDIIDESDIEEIHNLSIALKKFCIIYELHQEDANTLKQIMENIPDGIVMMEGCKIRTCNKAMTRIFGYSESELLGSKLHKLLPFNNVICEKNFLEDDCLLKDSLVARQKLKAKTKEGKIIDVELRSSEITLNNEQTYMFVIKDLSQQSNTPINVIF